jgi:hypothetical protein
MTKAKQPERVGVAIEITPRGVRRVRVFSAVKRTAGLDFYERLLPAIRQLDRKVREELA